MKKQDKVYWHKLLDLLAEDPEWYLKPKSKLYKDITTLGKQIFGTGNNKVANRINKKTFLRMESEGIPYNQIAIKLEVSISALHRWKKLNRGN